MGHLQHPPLWYPHNNSLQNSLQWYLDVIIQLTTTDFILETFYLIWLHQRLCSNLYKVRILPLINVIHWVSNPSLSACSMQGALLVSSWQCKDGERWFLPSGSPQKRSGNNAAQWFCCRSIFLKHIYFHAALRQWTHNDVGLWVEQAVGHAV